jgi:two-component system, NtrC family, response regulator HydG
MPELNGRRTGSRERERSGAVLVVDDDRGAGDVLVEALHHRRFVPRWVSSAGEAIEVLASGVECDVVLTDLRMPGASGLDLAMSMTRHHPTIPVVVLTAFGSIRTAVDAIQHGAYDFLTKPYDLELLALTLDRAIEHRRMRLELERLRAGR